MNGIISYPFKRYFASEDDYTTALALPSAVTGNRKPTSLSGEGGYWQPEVVLAGKGKNAVVRARGFSLQPVGTDADGEIVNFQIVGWRKFVTHSTGGQTIEYRPTLIWRGVATFGSNAGIANGYGTAMFFADTITESVAVPAGLSGLSNFSVVIHSPADNTDAFVTVQDASHIFDGFTFDTDLNTAASANLLVAPVF